MTIYDVADYFLNKQPITHKRLQRLCYLAQGWYLGNFDKPLIKNQFQAWIHGPVSPDLYLKYKEWGWNPIAQKHKNVKIDDPMVIRFLDQVYQTYHGCTDLELDQITRSHMPYQKARTGIPPSHYSQNPISQNDMLKYYKDLIAQLSCAGSSLE